MYKKIAVLVVSVLLVGLTIFLESMPSPQIAAKASQLIEFPEANTFEIRTDQNNRWHERAKGETPRYLRLNKTAAFRFNEIPVIAPANTIFKIVALNDNLVHLKLIEGGVIFDHRFTNVPFFIQAQSIGALAEPFSMGIITKVDDVVTLQALNGNQKIKINLPLEQLEHYLAQGQQIQINETSITDSWSKLNYNEIAAQLNKRYFTEPLPLHRVYTFNFDTYLQKHTALDLSYKRGATYASVPYLEKLIFNPVKRNLVTLNTLSRTLEATREFLLINQAEKAEANLAEFNSKLSELISKDKKATIPALNQWLQLYGSISDTNTYAPIKATLVKNGALILPTEQLLRFWSFAVDSQATWEHANTYFELFNQQIAQAKESITLFKLKERLLAQLYNFPAKNTLTAYNLLKETDRKLYEVSIGKEKLVNTLVLEKITQIRHLLELEANNQLEGEAIVEPLTLLLQELEVFYNQADFALTFEEYLKQELPNAVDRLQRLQQS